MKSVVSEKGQVTIPKVVRERLGIRPGQVLDFEAEGGRLVATKTQAQDPVDAVYGIATLDRPTDKLIAELRGPAPGRKPAPGRGTYIGRSGASRTPPR